MRVLMLSKACLVGIYQRKLEEIAPHVDALQVIVPPSWRDERGEIVLERVYTKGYDLAVEDVRFNGNFHLHYYPNLPARVEAFRPDVFHIDEEPYNLATWHALRQAKRFGARALFFTWQNIRKNYPPPFSWMERWVLNNVDHAIAGTDAAAEIWLDKGYKGPLSVIPQFGVDPGTFSPAKRAPERPFTIGYVGRLVPEKGVDLLLRAAAYLPGAWQLHIVGSGPEENALREMAASLGIADWVRWQPWVESTAMPDIYRSLDVLVLPSRTLPNWKEQFGRVIIEAQACGIPVIGSDSGAIPGVIGAGGLTFPEDNAEALAERLQTLAIDAPQRATLGQSGRKRVRERFTHARIAELTVDVYRSMLRVGRDS